MSNDLILKSLSEKNLQAYFENLFNEDKTGYARIGVYVYTIDHVMVDDTSALMENVSKMEDGEIIKTCQEWNVDSPVPINTIDDACRFLSPFVEEDMLLSFCLCTGQDVSKVYASNAEAGNASGVFNIMSRTEKFALLLHIAKSPDVNPRISNFYDDEALTNIWNKYDSLTQKQLILAASK
jgi:hypothetical protein